LEEQRFEKSFVESSNLSMGLRLTYENTQKFERILKEISKETSYNLLFGASFKPFLI
jgi:hypothetical protein